MTPLMIYWLKANLFLCLFYGCYWLLLRNHTFLRLNRVYLLGTLLLSFVLPLVQIPGLSLGWLWADDTPVTAVVTAEVGYVVGLAETPAPTSLPDWPELLYWTVLGGAGLLLLRIGWRTGRVLWRIHQWPSAPQPDHTVVYPPDEQTPTFSFFRYLVLNPADQQSPTVVRHELGHIRQRHSIDVLLAELVQAFCWPNPALWGYGRALRETHEFLADRYAAEQAPAHRDDYAHFLVNYAFGLAGRGAAADALTHPFSTNQRNFPTLKQRIQMIYKQHTQRRALWKYALVLPVATALLALTTAPESTPDSEADKLAMPVSEKTITSVRVSGVVRASDASPLPGATIEVKNVQRGTTTNTEGRFQLDAPAGSTLLVRFIGFKPQEIPVSANISVLNVNVVLDPASGSANVPKPSPEPYRIAPRQQGTVYTVVQQQPRFPGGMPKLFQFLGRTLRYPEEAVQKNVMGKVFVAFVVNADGRIDRIQVLKGIGAGCDEEAVRVVSLMPKWIPGKQNGKAVAVKYNLPISFQIDDKPGKASGTRQSSAAPTPGSQRTSLATASISGKPTVLLRSLMNQEPLYLIDGEEMTKAELDAIDPATIESINVWKSGPRLDTYGSKAQYGLVEVTLKAK
ncbi:TonB family protein [Fibrella sp. WM1]|uniref:M56 family metallopeptidase n=1 Tax=Fibrella musci TaxID=3242485 RepID=UPI00351F9554